MVRTCDGFRKKIVDVSCETVTFLRTVVKNIYTCIYVVILHDVRIYRVHIGNVKNRGPQIPNVSKYIRSVSNSFLYACFRSLFG